MDWVLDRKVMPLPGANFGRLIDVDDAETLVVADAGYPSSSLQMFRTESLIINASSHRSDSSSPSGPDIAYSFGPNSHRKLRVSSGPDRFRHDSNPRLHHA